MIIRILRSRCPCAGSASDVAVCCSKLQCVAVCCRVLFVIELRLGENDPSTTVLSSIMRGQLSVLQIVADCCSVLQCDISG